MVSPAAGSAAAPQQEAPPPPPPQQGPQPLTLDDAVRIALQRNPDLQKQVLLWLSSEQDKVLARSAILPNFDFNGSWSSTRQGGGVQIIQNTPIQQPTRVFQAWQAGF